jgi:hypothetical protein
MSTPNDERQAWLATLKVGDEVAVDYLTSGDSTWVIHKIHVITNSRRFQLVGSARLFNNQGVSATLTIEPVTDAIHVAIHRRVLISRIKNFKSWSEFSTTALEAIHAMIQRVVP